MMFPIRDTIGVVQSDGNWFATDGLDWKKSTLNNSINNLAFLDYVPFNGAVYGLGYFNGNRGAFACFHPEIYVPDARFIIDPVHRLPC